MLKFRFLFIIVFLAIQNLYSQTNIKITLKQTISNQAKLYLIQQSSLRLIDSSTQTSPEFFYFNLPAGYEQGVYRFSIGKNISFDFIVASEPQIYLETFVFAAEDSLKSINSKENEVYFRYKKIKKRFSQQTWFINSLIDYYPDSSLFRQQLNSELLNVQTELNSSSISLALNNPNLFVSNLILLEIKPIAKISQTPNERLGFLKQNWWNDANLKDIRLANSYTLETKIMGFMELFFNDSYDKEQQDSSFIIGVKTILNLDTDSSIKGYLRKILFDNYLETEYDATTKYLYETSLDGLPKINLSAEEKNSYEIQGKNGVGTKALDFSIFQEDGSKIKLSKIKSPYKLIVFWSLWCPHCTEMIPELYKTYQKYKAKGFEVIAISIDDEVDGWKRYVSEKKQSWINTMEPDNGKSRIILEYNVDGTPKLFLLDQNLTIISRPSNVNQLEVKLKQILK
jgi:thiol-disulfide isomerase/thioredoxin